MKRFILMAFYYLLRGRYGSRTVLREQSDERQWQAASRRCQDELVKKCKHDGCASKAVSADGKLLHGAAKNSFMAKSMRAA